MTDFVLTFTSLCMITKFGKYEKYFSYAVDSV